jgi:glycosyltransferase involved in cell wall biosynthesis
MRVLIFEPYHFGHRLHYVRTMLPGLTEIGGRVTLALSSETPGRPEYAAHLAPLAGQFELDAWMPPSAPLKALPGLLRESIRRTAPDVLLVPTADGLAQWLGATRGLRRRVIPREVWSEGLLLRGIFAYPQPNFRARLKALASRAAVARGPWSVLHHLDPLVYDRLRAGGEPRNRLERAMRLMPDPVEPPTGATRAEVLARYGLPDDGARYIGTVGLMDIRKGAHLLARAFAAAASDALPPAERLRETDLLLLAGPQDATVRALLAGEFRGLVESGRIRCIDRVLSAVEMADVLAAMDLVCTPHARHIGSASIVIRAAAAGRPVLGSSFGWIGYVLERFGLGSTVDESDPGRFARSLRPALDASSGFRLPAAAKRFVQFHSPQNFRAAWTANLRLRMGMPPAPGALTWEWVLEALDPSRPPAGASATT